MGSERGSFSPFQVFIKPVGSSCNLNCSYCYYPDTISRTTEKGISLMPDEIIEKYFIDHFAASPGSEYFFSWHGGEPTLAGLDFYRRAVLLQKKYKPSGAVVINGIQTNGTMLNDEWCRFFSEENFYVGVSIDGPQEIHDASRRNVSGEPSFRRTLDGYQNLLKYGIRNEILCVVSNNNAGFPLEVYSYFRSTGARYMTFLPLVIRNREGDGADTKRSVDPILFGEFLCRIFDEWLEKDIGIIDIQIIGEAIGSAINNDHTLCIFKKKCGRVPVIEMNGNMYSCDHYVNEKHLLGNIMSSSLSQLLESERQIAFGESKYKSLPGYCLRCEVLAMCNGECPKNRLISTPEGDTGLNYLCAGYRKFFNHIRPFTEAVAAQYRTNSNR